MTDEFEEAVYINGTWTWKSMETLKTYQIIHLVWGIFSLFPNSLLFYLVYKNKLHGGNFHFVILNWTIANLILGILQFYFSAVPQIHTFNVSEIIFSLADALIRFIPILFSLFFIFDKYVLSKKFCRISIYSIWGIFISLVIISTICLCFGVYEVYILVAIVALSKLASVPIFVIKWIIYCIRGSDENTYTIRLALSGMYIVTSSIQWFYTTIYHLRSYSVVLRVLLVILFYGNGLFNLIILVIYDSRIKIYFFQLLGKNIHYFNIQFSGSRSLITSTLESNKPIISEEEEDGIIAKANKSSFVRVP